MMKMFRWVIPALITCCFAVVYMRTVCPAPFPGDSAQAIAKHHMVSQFPPTTSPLWGKIVRGIASDPSQIVAKTNGISIVFGAFICGLIALLVIRMNRTRSSEELRVKSGVEFARLFSGVIAALAFGLSLPGWIVSTRAYPVLLAVILVLISFLFFQTAFSRRKLIYFIPAWFCYGLATSEYVALLFAGPIVLLLTLYLTFEMKAGLNKALPILLFSAVAWLGGYAFSLLGASLLQNHPSASWMNIHSFGDAYWTYMFDQWATLRAAIPTTGWLLILLYSAVPALVVLLPKKVDQKSSIFMSALMHFSCTCIAVVLLLNLKSSLWQVFGLNPVVVIAYVVSACWIGYLAGYWFLVCCYRRPYASKSSIVLRKLGAGLAIIIPIALIAFSASKSYSIANGRSLAIVDQWSSEVIDGLQGRDKLLIAGSFDSVLQLAAKQKGVKLDVLNPRLTHHEVYRNYLRSIFESPRLKSLCNVGIYPVLDEWIRTDDSALTKLAALNDPDIWIRAGKIPVPSAIVYLGSTTSEEVDPVALFEKEQAYWSNHPDSGFKELVASAPSLRNFCYEYSRQLGRSANNTGTLLEDLERPDLAHKAYNQSRFLDPNNLSALMNLVNLSSSGQRFEGSDLVGEELESKLKDPLNRYRLRSLAYFYGYIRDPFYFIRRGYSWAASGRPDLVLGQLKRAEALAPGKENIQQSLADLYFQTGDYESSEETCQQLLAKDPKNMRALRGMTRICLSKNQFQQAGEYLERMKREIENKSIPLPEEIVLQLSQGNEDEALELARQRAKKVKQPSAYGLQCLLAAKADDQEQFESASYALLKHPASQPSDALMLVRAHVIRKEFKEADLVLQNFLKKFSIHEQLLTERLRMDEYFGRKGQAELRVKKLLAVNPQSGYGNLIYGKLLYGENNVLEAESAWRVSLKAARSYRALNNLSYLLYERGQVDQALPLIEEALSISPDDSGSLDTYGAILLAKDRLPEAEAALLKALAGRPNSTSTLLSLLELKLKEGNVDVAKQFEKNIISSRSQLSPKQQLLFQKLQRQLSGNAQGPQQP